MALLIRFPFMTLALALTFAVAGSTSAFAADDGRVSSLLAAMRVASGGDAWNKVRSFHIVASVSEGGETVRRDQWLDVATGRYVVRTESTPAPRLHGYDGVSSWRQSRSAIAYTLGDLDSSLSAADEAYRVGQGWWFPERWPATIAYIGEHQDQGRRFDLINVTPENGRPFQAWIDQATHFLARTDEQQAEERVVTDYDDYKPVGGVMVPFTISEGDGDSSTPDEISKVQSVDLNPSIAEQFFSVPSRPPPDITFPSGRTSVEVPFRLTADNRILVPITLNGRTEVEAEFDTGGNLIIQPSTAREVGIAVTGAHKEGGGGEGFTTSGFGVLDRLQLGAAEVRGLAMNSFTFDRQEPRKALVGLEILQRFVVRLDFDRSVMTLTRPDAFHYAGHGAVAPFHFQDNQPEVIGAVDGTAGRFVLDTGDSGSLLLIAPFARRYGLVERYHADLPYQGSAVGGATSGVYARKRAGDLTLDGADGRPVVEVHNPITRISLQKKGFDANRDVSANIGLGVLQQFNLTFDYPHQIVIFEENHLYDVREIYNRTGLRLARDGEGWKVVAAYSGAPGDKAGLKVGDHIVRIDHKSPAELNTEALAGLSKGPVGSTLVFEITSGSGLRMVILTLRDVI